MICGNKNNNKNNNSNRKTVVNKAKELYIT